MTTQITRQLLTLTVDECLRHLQRGYVGRLAFLRDGRPEIVPLNYRFSDGTIVFRTGYGNLLDAVHHTDVAFEVDEWDDLDHTGWSVVVHGRAEEVWQADELHAIRELPLRPWAPGQRDHYVRIMTAEITGRRIGAAPHPL